MAEAPTSSAARSPSYSPRWEWSSVVFSPIPEEPCSLASKHLPWDWGEQGVLTAGPLPSDPNARGQPAASTYISYIYIFIYIIVIY